MLNLFQLKNDVDVDSYPIVQFKPITLDNK